MIIDDRGVIADQEAVEKMVYEDVMEELPQEDKKFIKDHQIQGLVRRVTKLTLLSRQDISLRNFCMHLKHSKDYEEKKEKPVSNQLLFLRTLNTINTTMLRELSKERGGKYHEEIAKLDNALRELIAEEECKR